MPSIITAETTAGDTTWHLLDTAHADYATAITLMTTWLSETHPTDPLIQRAAGVNRELVKAIGRGDADREGTVLATEGEGDVLLQLYDFGEHELMRALLGLTGVTVRYVRPKQGSDYGDNSGKSYGDAFNGIESTTFAASGVYYLCGFHMPTWTNTSSIAFKGLLALSSGISSARTTLRGDLKRHPGVIDNGHFETFATWSDETGGVWSAEIPVDYVGNYWFENPSYNSVGVLLTRASTQSEMESTPGSQWSDNYSGSQGGVQTIYIHTTDGLTPSARIVWPLWGYRIDYRNLSHIDIIGLEWRHWNPNWGNVTTDTDETVTDASWIDSTFIWSPRLRMFDIVKGSQNLLWDNCEIAYSGNGIYLVSTTSNMNIVDNFTVRNCRLHDFSNAIKGNLLQHDSHCVGCQGGTNGVISGNRMWNSDVPMDLYVFRETGPDWHQAQNNILIEDNVIFGPHGESIFPNSVGIKMEGDNDYIGETPGMDQNITVQNNRVFGGFDWGMQNTRDGQIKFLNNDVRDCDVGFRSDKDYTEDTKRYGSSCTLDGNFFSDCDKFIKNQTAASESDPGSKIVSDNNTFELRDDQSASDLLFEWKAADQSFATWKANSHTGAIFDPNSVMS
jgi:hypothetical protein